jgi:hypothetical protein
MDNIVPLEAKTEECPFFFEFKKHEIVGHHPTMAILNYDPFPNAAMDDVVRTEIICTELVLRAKVKTKSGFPLRLGIAIEFEGHKFAVKKATGNINTDTGESVVEVEGPAFLSPCEPIKALAQLRSMFAATIQKQLGHYPAWPFLDAPGFAL